MRHFVEFYFEAINYFRYGAIKGGKKEKKKISVTARGIQIFIKSFSKNSARLFFMENPEKT